VLDWQHFTNSGAFQGPGRRVDWTVSVTGSSSGLLDSVTATVNGTSGLETLSFSTPLTLSASEDWELKIHARGGWAAGNNTGLDAIDVLGRVNAALVPKPSTFVLAALGLLGLAFCARRRRRLP